MDSKTKGFIVAGLFVVCVVGIFLPFLSASTSYASVGVNFFVEVVGKISFALALAGAGLSIANTLKEKKGNDKLPIVFAVIILVLCGISGYANMNKASSSLYKGIDVHLGIGFYIIIVSMIATVVVSLLGKKNEYPTPVVGGSGGQPFGQPPMGQPMMNQPVNPMPQVPVQPPMGQPMQQPVPQPMPQQPVVPPVGSQIPQQQVQPPMGQPMNNNQQNNNFPNGQM